MLKDELEDFNIFALREYARRTGVSSPTSKRKDVLIAEILDIVEGRKAPNASNKFGRPPKEFHADAFGIRSQYGTVNAFNQESQSFDYSVFVDGKVVGYLEQNNNNFMLNIPIDGKILTHFVPYEISNKYDLRNGDKLCVTMSKHGNNIVIDELISINDATPSDFNNLRSKFLNLRHVASNNVLVNYKNGGLVINPADIVFIKGYSNMKNSLRVIDIMKSSTKTKNVYLNISLIYKTLGLIEGLNNSDNFTAMITDDHDYVYKIVRLAIDYVERLVESGFDVLFCVDDISSILNIENGEMIAKQILSLAKNTEEAGSLTLLAVASKDDAVKGLEKLCDKEFITE